MANELPNLLTWDLIAERSARTLARILNDQLIHLTKPTGQLPAVNLDAFLAYQPEIKALAHLCRAVCRQTGRETTLNHLIGAFSTAHGTWQPDSNEKALEATVSRFYEMIANDKNPGAMPLMEVVLTGWPLVHHFLNEYINETQKRVTLIL